MSWEHLWLFWSVEGPPLGETGCFAMGWGASRFEDKLFQVQMRQVELPIVHNPECQNFFRNTRLGDTFVLHDTFICAG